MDLGARVHVIGAHHAGRYRKAGNQFLDTDDIGAASAHVLGDDLGVVQEPGIGQIVKDDHDERDPGPDEIVQLA